MFCLAKQKLLITSDNTVYRASPKFTLHFVSCKLRIYGYIIHNSKNVMKNFESKEDFATNNLQKQLESAGIDTSNWGTGQAKTLMHLQKEIERGETILVTGEAGELLRQVGVGGADVYYESPDGKNIA